MELIDMQDEEKLSPERVLKKTQNRKIWTSKEDKLLERAIQDYGTNWKEVAKHLYNRNPSQCAQRWKRIKPVSQRCRHSWTPEEDRQLLELVKIHKRNWGQIASVMHWRTGKQIRERFINKLNPDIRSDPWTKEEDLIVMEAYQKYGSRWTDISKLLSGRPENMIKNRFYSFIRKEYMNIQNPYYIIPNTDDKIKKIKQHEEKEVLHGIADTHSSNELQVKEEDEEEVKQHLNLYNSQIQNCTHQSYLEYAAAMYYSYVEGIAKIFKSQSLSQSLKIENPPMLTNSGSIETQQSQFMIPNMTFLQFPFIVRQESFPQSMNNSQF